MPRHLAPWGMLWDLGEMVILGFEGEGEGRGRVGEGRGGEGWGERWIVGEAPQDQGCGRKLFRRIGK